MTNIDFTKSEQYTLSIRLSADGFSFSIHPPQKEAEVFFSSYPVNVSYSMTANLKKMIQTAKELKYTYGQINILIDTQRFTPIPFDLFEDEQTEQLFYQNFQRMDNETVLCNILGKSNIALIFGMDKHTHQLIHESFPHARIFACTSPLTEYFTYQSKGSNNRRLYVLFHPNRMEVFALDKGKLLLINSFNSKQNSDYIYYLLYVWQQLGYSQKKDQLFLIGDVESKDTLMAELKRFLRQVEFLPTLSTLPFDIQSLITCE